MHCLSRWGDIPLCQRSPDGARAKSGEQLIHRIPESVSLLPGYLVAAKNGRTENQPLHLHMKVKR